VVITSGRKRLRYVVWAPSTYPSETELWPVLCFLHGNGEAEPLDVRQAATRHGPLKPESAQKAADQFVIIFPQLPAPGGDVWRSYAREVRTIVEAVQTRFNGNPKQTYFTGFSYGADGVLDIAPDQKGFWSAVWAVDPTREHTYHPGCPVWLSSGPVPLPKECNRGSTRPCASNRRPRTETAISSLKIVEWAMWTRPHPLTETAGFTIGS
jgi:poly(3-hydroxybutyrate) depolymerase